MIDTKNLYQPDKYKVILGSGLSVGFCTLWNEPEKLLKVAPEILKRSAIIGTLYSRQGVNIILRNLALNPQIRNLYIWNVGALSCSPFGVSGKEILLKIWKNGVSQNGEVPETDFKIEKEINPEIVRLIIKNVSLKEITEQDSKKIAEKLKAGEDDPYMRPVRFAEAVPKVIDVFPSEQVGFLVRGKNIIDAWVRVIDRIIRYGTVKGTQYGTQQRELIGVTWVIENENLDDLSFGVDWPESLRKTIGLNIESINHYKSIFLSADLPEGIKYTYGSRLMNYPNEKQNINQIEKIIVKELKDSIDTRRAVATTLMPAIDKDSKEPPCITQIQVLQTNRKMHFLVTVRSHDIFKAAIPNAFGLRFLQQKIASDAGLEMGKLQITSQSAHIYEAEWEDAKKLVQCAIWNRKPDNKFNPKASADTRGIFIISVDNGKIIANFKTPSGNDLLIITGRTALEVSKKIAQLELINLPEHLLDIGAELQKAEIAISKNISYIQDRALKFN